MEELDWIPVRVGEIDILAPSRTPEPGDGPGPALVLVRVHSRPVDVVRLELGPGETVEDHRDRLLARYREAVARHVERFRCDGPPDGEPVCVRHRRERLAAAPPVSVVVATHDRPDLLRRCLHSLLDQDHPALEIVVVDNARSTDATERMVAAEFAGRSVRYVREDVAGLARAHNAGLAHVSGGVVAITDDDVVADRYWTAALCEAFADEGAGCVTGLILPGELRTRAQAWVEQYGGFARGFERRVYSLDRPPAGDPLFPFAPGRLGSGANMAFDRALLERIGGFDPALGAGTKARGGDDLAAFTRTLLEGATLVYQPDAVVHHLHHSDYAALRRMAQGYGVGLGAYLASMVAARPRVAADLLRRVPAGVLHLLSPKSEKNRNIRADYPRQLVRDERLGLLRGPLSYVASRRADSAAERATRA